MTAYALLATARGSGEYLTLTARTVHLADDGTPRNIPASDAYDRDPMAAIAATAQADRRDDGTARTYAYAFRLGLLDGGAGVHAMPTANVAASLATLRKVEAKLDRLYARFGSAATYGAWIARIADALGVPVLTGASGDDGFYSSGRWVTWTPGEAASVLDGWVAAFRADGTVPR